MGETLESDGTVQLVRRMMADDREAFDALMDYYYPKVMRMAYLISGNHADSEDIVQETFVTCYCNRKKIREPEHFDSWLYKTLTRTAWRCCKKGRREQPVEEVYDENRESGVSVLDEVIRRQEQEALYLAISSLPVKLRMTIILYYYNQMSVREIADVMQCFEGTVKSRLYTARKTLMQSLGGREQMQGKEAPS